MTAAVLAAGLVDPDSKDEEPGTSATAFLLCLAVGVCLLATVVATVLYLVQYPDIYLRTRIATTLESLGDSETGLYNFVFAPMLLLVAITLLWTGRSHLTLSRAAKRWLVALAVTLLVLTPAPLVGFLVFQSLFAPKFGWNGFTIAFLAGPTVVRALVCAAAVIGAYAIPSRRSAHGSPSDRPQARVEAVGLDAGGAVDGTLAPPEPDGLVAAASPVPLRSGADEASGLDEEGSTRTYAMSVVLGVATVTSILSGVVLAVYGSLAPGGPLVGPSNLATVSYSLQVLPGGDWTSFQFLVGPLLLVPAILLLRAARPEPSGVASVRRWFIVLAALELFVTLCYAVASQYPRPTFDRGTWSTFIGWCVVRTLLSAAVLLGAISLRAPRWSGVGVRSPIAGPDHTLDAVAPPPEVAREASHDGASAPGPRTLLSMSVVLVVAAGATLLAGAVVAIFSYYSPDYAQLDVHVWTKASLALEALPLGYQGSFQFLVGPLVLVTSLVVLRAAGSRGSAAPRVARWIVALSVLELAVTAAFVVATVIPTPDFGGSGFDHGQWAHFTAWCLVRGLLCVATVVGATTMPSSTPAAVSQARARSTDGPHP